MPKSPLSATFRKQLDRNIKIALSKKDPKEQSFVVGDRVKLIKTDQITTISSLANHGLYNLTGFSGMFSANQLKAAPADPP